MSTTVRRVTVRAIVLIVVMTIVIIGSTYLTDPVAVVNIGAVAVIVLSFCVGIAVGLWVRHRA